MNEDKPTTHQPFSRDIGREVSVERVLGVCHIPSRLESLGSVVSSPGGVSGGRKRFLDVLYAILCDVTRVRKYSIYYQ